MEILSHDIKPIKSLQEGLNNNKRTLLIQRITKIKKLNIKNKPKRTRYQRERTENL